MNTKSWHALSLCYYHYDINLAVNLIYSQRASFREGTYRYLTTEFAKYQSKIQLYPSHLELTTHELVQIIKAETDIQSLAIHATMSQSSLLMSTMITSQLVVSISTAAPLEGEGETDSALQHQRRFMRCVERPDGAMDCKILPAKGT